jgi:superfamily II DNA/RNA helicase
MSFISAQGARSWTIKDICDLVQQKFHRRPCWFQVKVVLALNAGKDVVGCAATGAGKTLSFWIPLLMALKEGKDKMIFVVTPLNLLGKQNEIRHIVLQFNTYETDMGGHFLTLE